MVVFNGTDLKTFTFTDPDTGKDFQVDLTIRDGLFFKILVDLTNSIRRIRK